MKFTKWNVLERMNSVDAVVEFLIAACKTPDDKDHIRSALAVAMQAVKTYGLQIATKEEADDLSRNDALIKQGTEKVYVIDPPPVVSTATALATA